MFLFRHSSKRILSSVISSFCLRMVCFCLYLMVSDFLSFCFSTVIYLFKDAFSSLNFLASFFDTLSFLSDSLLFLWSFSLLFRFLTSYYLTLFNYKALSILLSLLLPPIKLLLFCFLVTENDELLYLEKSLVSLGVGWLFCCRKDVFLPL